MASSTGMVLIGALLGAMFGYIFHPQIQSLLNIGSKAGLGAVGYSYQGTSSCGCGKH